MSIIGQAITLGGGGSGGSELTVVGGTTRPAKPTNNMVWVNTSHEITYVVFAAEYTPETIPNGLLWISIGASGTIDANAYVGDDVIEIYPINAKHRIDEAWVDVATQTFQNGLWRNWWTGQLYEDGNEYLDITGGWKFSHDGTKSDSYIRLGSETANSNENKYVRTENWISLESFNTVEVHFLKGRMQFSSSKLNIEAIDASGNVAATVTVKSGAINPIPDTTGVLDVSNLSGKYYIQVVIYWDSSSNAANIEYVDFDKVVCA